MTSPRRIPLGRARSRWLRGAAFAAALLAATVAVPPGAVAAPHPVAASEGAQWTVTPADADGPDGRVSLRHVLDPGTTTTDAIAVTNVGATATEFRVQSGDGVVGPDGAFDIRAADGGGPGDWIRVEGVADGSVLVAGGETRVLPVTIDVPSDALPGDHPAGIVIGVSQTSDDMAVQHRVGVRLHLQVTGDLVPALEVSGLSTSYLPSFNPFAPGVLQVDYSVTNTGNVRLGANEGITVTGPLGMAGAASSTAEPTELLPGATATRTQEVDMSPLVVLFGDVTVTAVAIGEDAVALPAAVVSGFTIVAIPWAAIIVVAAAAGLVSLIIWARRRSARRTQGRIDAAVAEARRSEAERTPEVEHAGAR